VNPVVTRTVTISSEADGIVRVEVRPEVDQTVADARENMELARRFVASGRAPFLIDVRQSRPIPREVRAVYAMDHGFVLAQAMLVDSVFTRIAANVFMRVARPLHCVRLFDDEREALEWLRERR